jgi:hypothetical protein
VAQASQGAVVLASSGNALPKEMAAALDNVWLLAVYDSTQEPDWQEQENMLYRSLLEKGRASDCA